MPLEITEDGNALIDPVLVWTGSTSSGTAQASLYFGATTGTEAGKSTTTDATWIAYGWKPNSEVYGLYAISDVLVAPEPASLSFLAIGGLALIRRRRQ